MEFQVQPFNLLELKLGVCPECLTEHPLFSPHSKDSLYYQCTFYTKFGCWPTWADAIAHCNREIEFISPLRKEKLLCRHLIFKN